MSIKEGVHLVEMLNLVRHLSLVILLFRCCHKFLPCEHVLNESEVEHPQQNLQSINGTDKNVIFGMFV